ncbi:hypothetical protein EIP91_008616 [Steccherinum ochraceum]|uniref:Uncharacterized protein n=1 Tax=Steccherinum ochraceum TaxID=92696 RepID=A0A4R0RKD2_9APHY|nr:hypothetical protein EIP91_008616 [Steccherinum ochraceum]
MATWQTARLTSTKKRDQDHIFGPSASLIVPRLYLSNFFYARSTEALKEDGITHIVSVLEQKPVYAPFLKGTLHISLTDTSEANILRHLDTTSEFIKDALAESPENKVLVHCLMGISRSATVVCAYLVASSSMSAREALDYTISKRAIVCPNIGFRSQLDIYSSRYHPSKGGVAKGMARIAGVSESIAARVKKLRRAKSRDGGVSQDDEAHKDKASSPSVTVTVSSLQITTSVAAEDDSPPASASA